MRRREDEQFQSRLFDIYVHGKIDPGRPCVRWNSQKLENVIGLIPEM
jgi:hypothetical protein